MKSVKVCEYSRSRSFHDDLILQDQASGARSQDQWSSGFGVQYTTTRVKQENSCVLRVSAWKLLGRCFYIYIYFH